ncbi:MAG: hypothetical protein N2112_00030 [Gemmataceae bacterium]|jgi:hypothetical protein|nr:hypothetical protein [Gemmataceae bacterium]
MSRLLNQVLVVVCAISLVFPAGWCCKVAWGGCCQGTPQAALPTDEAEDFCQPSSPAPKKCCCCETVPVPVEPTSNDTGLADRLTDRSAPAKAPQPIPHGCCEPVDAILNSITIDCVDLSPSTLFWELVWDVRKDAPRSVVGHEARSHSPPLHVFLCVWRC